MDCEHYDKVLPPLPPGSIPLKNQVAGHIHGKSKRRLGLLQKDNQILKPLEASANGIRELKFYEFLCSNTDPVFSNDFYPFVPRFYGISSYCNVRYIHLENACHSFKQPCIIDLKIGGQTWDPDATDDYINRKRLKYPPCQKLGFQIVGYQKYEHENRLVKHEKRCLRKLDADQLVCVLASFFDHHSNAGLIRTVMQRVQALHDVVEKQRSYLFYATSLLIIYEKWRPLSTAASDMMPSSGFSRAAFNSEETGGGRNNNNRDNMCQAIVQVETMSTTINHVSDRFTNGAHGEDVTDSDSDQEVDEVATNGQHQHQQRSNCPSDFDDSLVDVRLIDFVHVYPNTNPGEPDDNFLHGLRSFIDKLESLLDPAYQMADLPQLRICLESEQTTCAEYVVPDVRD